LWQVVHLALTLEQARVIMGDIYDFAGLAVKVRGDLFMSELQGLDDIS